MHIKRPIYIYTYVCEAIVARDSQRVGGTGGLAEWGNAAVVLFPNLEPTVPGRGSAVQNVVHVLLADAGKVVGSIRVGKPLYPLMACTSGYVNQHGNEASLKRGEWTRNLLVVKPVGSSFAPNA